MCQCHCRDGGSGKRDRARAASKFGVDLRGGAQIDARSEFTGYTATSGEGKVVALVRGGAEVAAAEAGDVEATRRRQGRAVDVLDAWPDSPFFNFPVVGPRERAGERATSLACRPGARITASRRPGRQVCIFESKEIADARLERRPR